ncbi:transposase [Bradyrhizobium elkanii]|uniref:transposase n=1 Tax=Bradyrhizobium elkanii TaxID=29448 RepID=UPI003B986D6A
MPKVSRLEVVSTGARRRWTLEEKQRIVTESYGGPRLVSVTARRNGLSTSQLFTWRRLAREGKLSGDAAPVLVPVEMTPAAAPISSGAPQPCLHRLRNVHGPALSRSSLGAAVACALTGTWTRRRCSGFLSF